MYNGILCIYLLLPHVSAIKAILRQVVFHNCVLRICTFTNVYILIYAKTCCRD
jgi:hypothetical protein